MSKPHVIVYSRPGCHLCDEAKAVILNADCSDHFTLEEINIESDDELLRKYKYDIPVVTIDGIEAHRFFPFATIKRRAQIGLTIAGGVGSWKGAVLVDETCFITFEHAAAAAVPHVVLVIGHEHVQQLGRADAVQ